MFFLVGCGEEGRVFWACLEGFCLFCSLVLVGMRCYMPGRLERYTNVVTEKFTHKYSGTYVGL